MKYLLILVALLASACTTFQNNEAGVRQACKAGVQSYDDGTTSFACAPKK